VREGPAPGAPPPPTVALGEVWRDTSRKVESDPISLFHSEVDMRLKSFRVTSYKSILDSGQVQIDTNATCLMGMNESGKSACMQALWKFRNVSGVKYDKLFDLPAELYTLRRKDDPNVVRLTFSLEERDKKALKDVFPDLSGLPKEIAVVATYEGKHNVIPVGIDYPSLTYDSISKDVAELCAELDATAGAAGDDATKKTLLAAKVSLNDFAKAGESAQLAYMIPAKLGEAAIAALSVITADKLKERCARLTPNLKQFTEAEAAAKKLRQWLWDQLPNFIYFDDYGRLRTRINLPDFIHKKTNPPPAQDEQKQHRSQVALFEWASLDPNEVRQLGRPKEASESQEDVERRKAERSRLLESASFKLSGDWKEWWDGSSHQLHFDADGDDLTLSVADDVNPWEIPFAERSRGFQWFFSFYLTFLVESKKAHQGSILLLDEPGLHLHLARQLKLLKFFQKIADVNQIIYSSHSPFMVDPDHVDNVRTVYLEPKQAAHRHASPGTKEREEKADGPRYTKVSKDSEPAGDRDTLLPLQYAGAYLLAQTLFLGKRTLIVEGISDYWMLRTLSNYAREHGGGHIHDDTVILWAGGTSRIVTLASVMAAREQVGPNRIAILLDSDKAGTEQARRLIDMLVHGSDSLRLIGDIINVKRATVEDIAEPSEFLNALKKMGRDATGAPTRKKDETNVQFLSRLFKENSWGDLSMEEKAKLVLELVDYWRSNESEPAKETIARARLVFASVNACFDALLSKP